MSLANFSPSPRQVTVKYALTRDGAATLSTIAKVTLAPLSSQEVTLSGLNGDPLLRDSFVVESDGIPGGVGTKLVSKSSGQLREVELLAKDFDDSENGGNHPWTVEDGTTSTLLLFNQSDKAQWFNVEVSAGATVWRKSYRLQSEQTEAININDLINSGAKDNHGNELPRDIQSGQVGWNTGAKNAGRGRLLQSNPTIAMARSFSCGWILELCGADLNITNDMIPLAQTRPYGDIADFLTCMNTCNGSPVGGGEAYYYNYGWSSYNSTVASIASYDTYGNSNVHGGSVGGTNIGGWATDGYCSVNVTGPVSVPPSLSLGNSIWFFGFGVSPPSTFTLGNIQSVLTANNASGGSFYWTITHGAYAASFASGTQQSSITTSGNTVTLYSIGLSTSANDVTVQLTWTPQGGSPITISMNLQVDSPYLLTLDFKTGPTAVSTCAPSYSSGNIGWWSHYRWRMFSFFGVQMPGLSVNENFDNVNDYQTNNLSFTPNGSAGQQGMSTYADDYCFADQTVARPHSTAPQSPLTTSPVDSATQFYNLGSDSVGSGVTVQTQLYTRYVDHSTLTNIVSPVR